MPESGGDFEIIIERTQTLDSSAYIYSPILSSNAFVEQEYRIVKTDTTEGSPVSLTTIEFTTTKPVLMHFIMLKCRGLTGASAQIQLTLNAYGGGESDTDTITIGNNTADYILHKFTFDSPVPVQAGGLNVITITEVVGQIDVQCGNDDNSGWDVVGRAE